MRCEINSRSERPKKKQIGCRKSNNERPSESSNNKFDDINNYKIPF